MCSRCYQQDQSFSRHHWIRIEDRVGLRHLTNRSGFVFQKQESLEMFACFDFMVVQFPSEVVIKSFFWLKAASHPVGFSKRPLLTAHCVVVVVSFLAGSMQKLEERWRHPTQRNQSFEDTLIITETDNLCVVLVVHAALVVSRVHLLFGSVSTTHRRHAYGPTSFIICIKDKCTCIAFRKISTTSRHCHLLPCHCKSRYHCSQRHCP